MNSSMTIEPKISERPSSAGASAWISLLA